MTDMTGVALANAIKVKTSRKSLDVVCVGSMGDATVVAADAGSPLVSG